MDKKNRKKLILFDIDGTLVLTGGIAMNLMIESISKISGGPVTWNIRDFVGNTDQNIIRTLLHRNGMNEVQIADFVDEILDHYVNQLKIELMKDGVIQILDGVEALLNVLKNNDQFSLGLLTGNILDGAEIKLSRNRIFDYFPIGAFGNDALKREQLPPFAIQRAEKYYRHFFDRRNIWIVGDSVNDIRCAQANHIRCLAVASGHTPLEELEPYHPDAILKDLTDTKTVIDILSS
jgi:phosphoglycolate phosphatase-like HAD superfamily hydrolase